MTEVFYRITLDKKGKAKDAFRVRKQDWEKSSGEEPNAYFARLEDDGTKVALVPDFPTPFEHWPRIKNSGDALKDAMKLNDKYAEWF